MQLEDLIQLRRSDPERAAKVVIDQYYAFLYRLIKGLCWDHEWAQDLVLKTFETFFATKWHDLKPSDKLGGWLATACVNNLRNDVKRKNLPTVSLETLEEVASTGSDPYKQIDERISLQECLARISPLDQAIIEAKYFDGLTFAEMEPIFKLSKQDLCRRANRALPWLRDLWVKEDANETRV